MPTFRTGEVIELLSVRPGLRRVRLSMEPDGSDARAFVLTDLVGDVDVGDQVVCNTTAVDLGLGTGGWHVVHWNLSRREFERAGPDHIMKLRYTSLQFDAGTSELEHPDLPATLDSMPVVVCQVHSQVGVVAAAIGALRPGTRVSYVMTDGASLPLVMSDLVVELRDRGLLNATITAGHAFGGDLEAVTVPSALLLARHVADSDAEIVIVGMGPGVVGTGTRFGTTSIEAATIIDAVAALGGRPVLCVRASDGDARERHQGISHHTLTALDLAHAEPFAAAIPPEITSIGGIRILDVTVPDIEAILTDAGLRITTMARDVAADRLFFDAAAAAGAVAVALVDATDL